jgi:hypothetical protein
VPIVCDRWYAVGAAYAASAFKATSLVMIRNGIDLRRVVAGSGVLIDAFCLLEAVKRIHVLIRTAVKLATRHADWRFVTAESGSDAERNARAIGELYEQLLSQATR